MNGFLSKFEKVEYLEKYGGLEEVLERNNRKMVYGILGGYAVVGSVCFGILRSGLKRRNLKFAYYPILGTLAAGYGLVSGLKWFVEKEATKEILNIVEVDDEVLGWLEEDNQIHVEHFESFLFK
jgi:hypothetical protein